MKVALSELTTQLRKAVRLGYTDQVQDVIAKYTGGSVNISAVPSDEYYPFLAEVTLACQLYPYNLFDLQYVRHFMDRYTPDEREQRKRKRLDQRKQRIKKAKAVSRMKVLGM